MLSLSNLDPRVAVNVVNTMIQINQLSIVGLMKYEIIEIDKSSLYLIMREYKTHLDEIDPVKYFEDSGIYDVLNGILMVLKSMNENDLIKTLQYIFK